MLIMTFQNKKNGKQSYLGNAVTRQEETSFDFIFSRCTRSKIKEEVRTKCTLCRMYCLIKFS